MPKDDPAEMVDTKQIVQNAKGDHMTADKLTGKEPHFPECRHVIKLTKEEPHYIILLTNSRREGAVTFGMNHGEFSKVGEGNSCLLFTNDSMIAVSQHTGHIRIPYSSVEATMGDFNPGGGIVVNISTSNYRFNIAKKAEFEPIIEATKFLYSKIS